MSELVRVTRGVWRRADDVADLHGLCAALLAACADGSVLADVTAARLRGCWLPPQPDPANSVVSVILRRDAKIPRAHAGSRRAQLRARRRELHPDDVDVLDGLPVTSAARTWVDLAELLSAPDLVAAGDWVLRGRATRAELAAAVHRAHRHRGVVLARRLLPLLDPASESRPESHLRYGLISRGLPKPSVNKDIFSAAGEWLFRPDLAYEEAKLALEYNGAEHAKLTRMRKDMTRGVDVGYRGRWLVVSFGPDEVFRRMDLTASYVRELLRERAPDLLRSVVR
jgi:hypothetical protein